MLKRISLYRLKVSGCYKFIKQFIETNPSIAIFFTIIYLKLTAFIRVTLHDTSDVLIAGLCYRTTLIGTWYGFEVLLIRKSSAAKVI